MAPGIALTIRPLHDWHEYLAAEELQRLVWQMPDWRDVVPANLLITAHKNGGIVLGAFDAAQHLIGFVFSFPGWDEQRGQRLLKQCSHMLAVLPEFQGQQIGERLKFAQRQVALAQHIPLITWTYDPLLALNANLNLVRLGAIARQYIVNAYGEMTDALNAGLPSDRFQVEWWLESPRVHARTSAPPPRQEWEALIHRGAQPIFQVQFDARELPRITHTDSPTSETLMLEIPANLSALKAQDAPLALDWRMQTRQVFQQLFAAGYVAVDFVLTREAPARAAYVLTQQPTTWGIEE